MRTLEHTFENGRSRVSIGVGALRSIGQIVDPGGDGRQTLVVSDDRVGPLYAEAVATSLREAGWRCALELVPAGEGSKSLGWVERLYERLAELRLGRDGLLVAVGGGVVSDLTGFVAATWLRGVDFAICPTSLEAAVDASVGGKTAVNLPAGKNLVGAFHQPTEVLIDPETLRTLPQRDMVAGLAESLKHALIADASFADWHRRHREGILACDAGVLEELIERNVSIKAGVVLQDACERSGVRARLNFGHTVGHAIEASCGYDLRHGECVALGMVAAARISQMMGLLDSGAAERVAELVTEFGLPVRYPRLAEDATLLDFMVRDKKAAQRRIRWVLLERIGTTVQRDDVPEEIILEAVQSLR